MTDVEIGKWFARATVPHGGADGKSRIITLAHLTESTKYRGDLHIMRCGREMEADTARGTLIEAPHEPRCYDCKSARGGSDGV